MPNWVHYHHWTPGGYALYSLAEVVDDPAAWKYITLQPGETQLCPRPWEETATTGMLLSLARLGSY
jgi:hypothetical protein